MFGNELDLDENIGDIIKVIKYIYDKKLNSNKRLYFDIYFVKEYKHDEVVALNIGIKDTDSSKSTKCRLKNEIQQITKEILQNDRLLDGIRWKF